MIRKISIAIFLSLAFFGKISAQSIPLTPQAVELVNVKMEEVTYKGKKGIRAVGIDPKKETFVLVKGLEFRNGTIELEVSGKPLPEADSTHRGFVGIVFRFQKNDSIRYECFYVRPTNGRSSDQLRRNHTVQYDSRPGFPWFKLRKENPGVYESYADMVPGEWIRIRIVVRDKNARMFVNGADQPCLIVNDLKLGNSTGGVALWPTIGTDAYFANLKITKDK